MTNKEEVRKQKAEALMKLIAENPTLPIVPMVHYEVVAGDDWGYWMGSFGSSSVGEYALYNDKYFNDRESFKEEYYDYHDEELCEKFNYEPMIEHMTNKDKYTKEQFDTNRKNGMLLDEYLDRVAEEYFMKAIIVYIELPEV